MKSYDAQGPLTISYAVGDGIVDIADGVVLALAIQRPANVSSCRVEEVHVQVTETFNAVTTSAFVRIGTAADADKFAELDLGVAAATNGYGTNDDADAIKAAGKFIDLDRDGDAGAALTQLEVTTLANTGGTPAGQGTITVVLSWF
jgi:hypothetical protein